MTFECFDQGELQSTAKSPEGAVEWLRRELESAGCYSRHRVVGALADLREDGATTVDDRWAIRRQTADV